MSQTIRNLAQLQKAYDKYCYYLVDKAGEKVKEKIDEFIKEYYKEYPNPKYYERVWNFLNSVVKTEPKRIGNGYEVEIYIDTSLVYKNGWTMEGTAIQANKGMHGWNHPVMVGDSHFWDDAMEEVPSMILEAFGEFMASKGISISFK